MSNNLDIEVVNGENRVPGIGPRRVAGDRCIFIPSKPSGQQLHSPETIYLLLEWILIIPLMFTD